MKRVVTLKEKDLWALLQAERERGFRNGAKYVLSRLEADEERRQIKQRIEARAQSPLEDYIKPRNRNLPPGHAAEMRRGQRISGGEGHVTDLGPIDPAAYD